MHISGLRLALIVALLAGLLAGSSAHAQTGTAKPKATLSSEVANCFPDNVIGEITPAITRQCVLDFIASWQQFASVNPQAGTSYTINVSDYGKLVTFNNAAPVAVTLPQATGSFAVFNTYVLNNGAGAVTVTPTTSTINGAATLALTVGQSAWIVSDGTNYQVFSGSGSGSGGMVIGGTVTSGTPGSVLFVNTGPVLAQDNAKFFWDETNKRLGLGTASPSATLTVVAPSGLTQAINASQSLSGTTAANCVAGAFEYPCANLFVITGDTVDATSPSGNIDGWMFNHTVSAGIKGNRQAVDAILNFTGLSNNAGGNYLALAGETNISANDGGTGTALNTARGAAFGGNLVVRGTGAATDWLSVTGLEIDINWTGTTAQRLGIALVSVPSAQGVVHDAAVEIGSVSGAGNVGWLNGILFSNLHGRAPLDSTGCALCPDGSTMTVGSVADWGLGGVTISNWLIRGPSGNFSVDGSGNAIAAKITLTNATGGGTQCLQASNTGVVSGTGGACGAGGGAVNSVADSGTGTLTISPTTGTVLAAINLANANAWTAAQTIASASAAAFAVGLTAANPSLKVDDSTASQVAGLSIKGAVTGGTVALAAIDSGAAANISINAKGTGTIGIGSVSTGAVTITPATTLSNALTYGGVTLANTVTGTGSMVLASSPSLATPALGVATATSLALGGATIGGNALAVTGTVALASITGSTQCLQVNSSGVVSGTSSTCGSGGTATPVPPQGRITLTSATPVLTANVTNAVNVFYTPSDAGNIVPIYDGANMIPTACAELTNISTNSATGSAGPAVVAASSVYDYFVWNNSGCTLTRGPAWTNDGARSAGTALVRVNGILLNNVTITNGPAASRGTYVGTCRSNASSQFDYIFGGTAGGGTAAWFGCWNAYNKARTQTIVSDNTVTWNTLTGISTLNAGGTGSGLNNRVSFVVGLKEDFAAARIGYICNQFTSNPSGVGIGYNSTSAISGFTAPVWGTNTMPCLGEDREQPLGFNFFQALDFGGGGNRARYGNVGDYQGGMTVELLN